MKEKVNFLFVIDISGSMYGQKIASVNASLAECMAELKQIDYSEKYDIKVSLVTFAEKMLLYEVNKSLDNICSPHIEVKLKADGLYSTTSFGCLYRGLKYLLDDKRISDEKEWKNTFIILFSDAKPIDEKESNAAHEAIQNCIGFKNATKYVAYAEDDSDMFNGVTVKFVDYKANYIVRASEMPGEINKLQFTFFSDFTGQSDDTKYD